MFAPAVTGASVTWVATMESAAEATVIVSASKVSVLPVASIVEFALTLRLPPLTWIVVFWVTVTVAGVPEPVPMSRSPLSTRRMPLLRLVAPMRSVLAVPPSVVSVKPSRSTPPSSVIVAPSGVAPFPVASSVALPVSFVLSSVIGWPAVSTVPIRNVLPVRPEIDSPPVNNDTSLVLLPRAT